MDVNQNAGVFTVSLLKTTQKSRCSLVETLEKDVVAVRIEARHGLRISSELDSKLEWFTTISNALSGKLRSLWSLAEMRSNENNEIKEFADQISSSWTRANKQVSKEYARIRVASRTLSGTPLTTLLDKIRKQATAVKVSLQIGEVIYDQEYVAKGFALFDEIMTLLKTLDKCDDKVCPIDTQDVAMLRCTMLDSRVIKMFEVQQYLAICKMTPYLLELESAVDKFVSTTDLLPASDTISSRMTALPILVDLLTGELLSQEIFIPSRVLAENAPRKPIFITKNNKKRMDIPALPATKMPKSSYYLSSFH